MSKIKDRIQEIERITRKSRRINNALWVVVIIFVASSIGLGAWAYLEKERAEAAEQEAVEAKKTAEEAQMQIAKHDSITQLKLDALAKKFYLDAWEQAKSINTLQAYSTYAANQQEGIHADSLQLAVNSLLNKTGFVQIVETDGDKLFKSATLNLEGEFIRMNKSVNVRKGQWDTPGYNTKVGVVPESQIVMVKNRLPSQSSKSVWAEIAFRN